MLDERRRDCGGKEVGEEWLLLLLRKGRCSGEMGCEEGWRSLFILYSRN
jgi:hypothetical protein